MNRTFLLAVIAAGLITSCATVQHTPAAAPPSPPPPPVAEAAAEADRPVYICPDGHRVELAHDAPAGVMNVTRGGETYVLQQQVSTSGRLRFVDNLDTLEIYDGEIQLRRGPITRQVCPLLPAAPERGIIHGRLAKLDRMALPPGSVAKVLLVDASRADAPAVEIASTTISTTDNQPPLHFLLRYDADRLVPRSQTYRLQARLSLPDGKLGWITDTATFVLENDAPPLAVELMLARVGS